MDLASVIKEHSERGDSFETVHNHVLNIPSLLQELIRKHKDLEREIRYSLAKEISATPPDIKKGA